MKQGQMIQCQRKVESGVNVRGLKLECSRILHEALLITVLMYSSLVR